MTMFSPGATLALCPADRDPRADVGADGCQSSEDTGGNVPSDL